MATPLVRLLLPLLLLAAAASAQLSPTFYAASCPNALSIIQRVVQSAVAGEPRMGASLLRLHFHDCFVQGCDGSVLLDDTSTFTGEKTAFPNVNSLRGFNVIDTIKSSLEAACPGIVSCADIVAVAARDSVVALGGPSWNVALGRRDSTTASFSGANSDLPGPANGVSGLDAAFANKGFSQQEMVALSGAHTIGRARCVNFRSRLYSESNINLLFAILLKLQCPSSGGDNNLAPLDASSPDFFDSGYYRNLLLFEGLLHSDQQLYSGGSGPTDAQVRGYAFNQASFFNDFAAAMVKMSSISPLTGSAGQIRTNCRAVNS